MTDMSHLDDLPTRGELGLTPAEQLAEAKATIKALRAALEPFARVDFPSCLGDRSEVMVGNMDWFRVRHFREARRVWRETGEE